MPAAFAIHILKQFRTRQFAASFQNARELAVTDYAAMTDAALGAKIELDLPTPDANSMMILERREAETFVLPSVFGITYTRQGMLTSIARLQPELFHAADRFARGLSRLAGELSGESARRQACARTLIRPARFAIAHGNDTVCGRARRGR